MFQRAKRELQVGQILQSEKGQEYTIERNISRTLSSQVLGAVRNQDRVEVAIKAPIIQVDEDAKRFERELQILYQVVGRPGIIRILDHGKNSEFAVLEYIGEITLSRLIKALSYNQIALKPKEVISILKQMTLVAIELERVGVYSRDIKPSNFFIGDMRIKAFDFGIAKGSSSEDLTPAGTVIGTCAYMAPEMMFGAFDGPRSEIFSIATVGAELVTGRRIVDNEELNLAQIHQLRSDEVYFGEQVPRRLQRTLQRALQMDPGKRQRNFRVFFEDLESAEEEIADEISGVRRVPTAEDTKFIKVENY